MAPLPQPCLQVPTAGLHRPYLHMGAQCTQVVLAQLQMQIHSWKSPLVFTNKQQVQSQQDPKFIPALCGRVSVSVDGGHRGEPRIFRTTQHGLFPAAKHVMRVYQVLVGQSAPTPRSRAAWSSAPPFQPDSLIKGKIYSDNFYKVLIQKFFKLSQDKCQLIFRNGSI